MRCKKPSRIPAKVYTDSEYLNQYLWYVNKLRYKENIKNVNNTKKKKNNN